MIRGAVRRIAVGAGFLTATTIGFKAWGQQHEQKFYALPPSFILELDLETNSLVECKSPSSLLSSAAGYRGELPLSHAVRAIHHAASDQRVAGLLGLIGILGGVSLAQVQELRDSVVEFRSKAAARSAWAVAYADCFGEGGSPGTGAFYLATAFDRIYMAPTGMVSCTGLGASMTFMRGLLDRFKIVPRVFQREEYKSAVSLFNQTNFTPAEREALDELLKDLAGQVVDGIAAARGLTLEQARQVIDTAPHMASQALELGLIDGVLYRDQALSMAPRLHQVALAERARLLLASAADAALPVVKAFTAPAATPYEQRRVLLAALRPAADTAAEEVHRGLLEKPDVEPARKLRRVSLEHYLKAVDLQARREQAGRGLLSTLHQLAAGEREQPGIHEEEEEEGGSGAGKPPLAAAGGGSTLAAAWPPKPVVAVIQVRGAIALGPGSAPPRAQIEGQGQVASLPLVKALAAARAQPIIKAVVLRIDSPGGSAVASDVIHREISLLRRAGKPVVVSMGAQAASGAYYVSCPATKIVAQPATLTGSVGVVAGKVVFREALKEYGINAESLREGKNAHAASAFTDYTPEQERQVNAMVDTVYQHFLEKVAAGRGMTVEEVRKVAKGRVWTGRQALQLGLVDELGGLQDAILLAKAEAGLPTEDEGAVEVRSVWPLQKPPLAQLLQLLRGSSSGQGAPAATLAAAAAMVLGAGSGALPGLSAQSVVAGAQGVLAEQGLDGTVQLRNRVAEVEIRW